jgi:hypothetical protein
MANKFFKLIIIFLLITGCASNKERIQTVEIKADTGQKIRGVYWKGNIPNFLYTKRGEGEKLDTIRYSIISSGIRMKYIVYEN